MITVVLNGSGGVGKTTFAALCGKYAACKNISSIGEIRDMAARLGCDTKHKDDKSRAFLSDLVKLADDYYDYRFNFVTGRHNMYATDENWCKILFVDVREPRMIERIKNAFNAVTLFIDRPYVEDITSNPSDRNVRHYSYDYTIMNDGSFEDLEKKAKDFVEEILRAH